MNRGTPEEGIEIRDWSQMSAELVFLYDGEIQPEHLALSSSGEDLSALLIRKGAAVFETGGGRIKAGQGDWVFAPAGARSHRFTAGSHVLSIHFLLSWPGRFPVYDWDRVLVIPSTEAPELQATGEQLMEYVTCMIDPNGRRMRYTRQPIDSYFGLYRHFFAWVEGYGRLLAREGVHPIRQGRVDPRVLKAAQLLERRSFREPLLQAELAAEVNLSVNHLSRLFRAAFRLTPKAYMERRRAREAYLRVQNSKDSFKEIAYDLGFHSPAHFSTWFSQRYSHTPRDVREHGHSLFPRQL